MNIRHASGSSADGGDSGVSGAGVVTSHVAVAAATGDAGEEADEDEAHGGHAGADKADIDLDGGPERDREVIRGGVVGRRKDNERLQSNNRDDGDAVGRERRVSHLNMFNNISCFGGEGDVQGADDKHESDADLLLPVEIERLDLDQGNGQHPKVKNDADGGIGPGESIGVDTVALVLAVPVGPEEADGLALENGNNKIDNAPDDVKSEGAPK